jgi:hypothetical protein
MNQINQHNNLSVRTQDIKDSVRISELVGQHIQLAYKGTTLMGLCPFHSETEPSFAVYDHTQSYYCFSCGESGDIFSFVMKRHNIPFMAAVTHFDNRFVAPTKANHLPLAKPAKRPERIDKDYTKIPEIDFNKIYSNKLHKFLKANNDLYYRYDFADNQPAGYIIRMIDKKGKKMFWPIGLTEHPVHGLIWAYGPIGNPRPLYNLPEIIANPNKPVLIVEGEKCVEAAKALLTDFVVTTWCGGSQAVGQTDWGILNKREVFMWPDNDSQGQKAAEEISTKIMNIEFIPMQEKWPTKWDIADEIEIGSTKEQLTAFILKYRRPKPKDPTIYNYDLPPGLAGELTKYILDSASKPQPILAIGAAFTIMAILQAQKFATEDGIHPNMYIITIAPSSTGKDHPRKMIIQILNEIGCMDLVSASFASGAGLIHGLNRRQGRMLAAIDEFGPYLKGVTGKDSSMHQKDIITKLLRLYSDSSGFYIDDEYSQTNKERRQIIIAKPNLVLYGTTTPDMFYKSLTANDSNNGFLSRIIVLQGADPNIKPRKVHELIKDMPITLKTALQLWAYTPSNIFGSEVFDNYDFAPTPIPYEMQARALLHEFRDECTEISKQADKQQDHFRCTLYHRAFENASKISLLCRTNGLFIDKEAVEYAIRLIKQSIELFYNEGISFLNDSDFGSLAKEILRYLKGKDVWVDWPTITRQFPMAPKDFKEMITHLLDSDQIELKEKDPDKHSKYIRKSSVFRYKEQSI